MSFRASFQAVRSMRWDTPLVSLRLLAMLAFVSLLVSATVPRMAHFLTGTCVTFTGMLLLQVFRLKSVEERPDPREQEPTRLNLGGV
jgi:hypothetical protein